MAIFAMISNLSPTYGYVVAAAGALGVAVMLGTLLYLDRTKCPNCGERLGLQIANQYGVGRRVAFCPFCGAGFDKCEVRNSS
jgi:ribosomal protein S27AE